MNHKKKTILYFVAQCSEKDFFRQQWSTTLGTSRNMRNQLLGILYVKISKIRELNNKQVFQKCVAPVRVTFILFSLLFVTFTIKLFVSILCLFIVSVEDSPQEECQNQSNFYQPLETISISQNKFNSQFIAILNSFYRKLFEQ